MKAKSFPKIIIVLIVLFVLSIVVNMCTVVTYPNELTVIKQFGKIVEIREEPGLSFKAPFIQTAEKIENEVLLYDLAVSDVMTKDKKSQSSPEAAAASDLPPRTRF